MTIEELVNRYFEGATSAEEEARLRAFFRTEKVPPHLVAYRPLFAYFEEEILRAKGSEGPAFDDGMVPPPAKQRPKSLRQVLCYVSGMAASVLLALGLFRILSPADPCFCADNYVVVNGRCYTDIHKVRALALEALEEVAAPAGDYFPAPEIGEEADRVLVEHQLDELRSVFNDND